MKSNLDVELVAELSAFFGRADEPAGEAGCDEPIAIAMPVEVENELAREFAEYYGQKPSGGTLTISPVGGGDNADVDEERFAELLANADVKVVAGEVGRVELGALIRTAHKFGEVGLAQTLSRLATEGGERFRITKDGKGWRPSQPAPIATLSTTASREGTSESYARVVITRKGDRGASATVSAAELQLAINASAAKVFAGNVGGIFLPDIARAANNLGFSELATSLATLHRSVASSMLFLATPAGRPWSPTSSDAFAHANGSLNTITLENAQGKMVTFPCNPAPCSGPFPTTN